MERLTGMDATFLYIETPAGHMHVAMVGIYDVSTMPGGYSFDRIKQHIAERLQGYDPQALSADHVNRFLSALVQPVRETETVPTLEALDRIVAHDAGADEVLAKPFKASALLAASTRVVVCS